MSRAFYTLHTCGCRGSQPVNGKDFLEFGGQTTCYILCKENYALILDCGTGLYDAQPLLAQCSKIDVLITHLHYDHILGLLSAENVFPKNAVVTFYSTFDNWFGQESFQEFFRAPFWPTQPHLGELVQLPPQDTPLFLNEDLMVKLFPSNHPNEANMIFLQVREKRIMFLFDYEYNEELQTERLMQFDLIVYDGMYTDEEYPRRIGWGHSTWQEGCRLAQKVKPTQLIITHHAPRRTDAQLQQMEQKAQTMVAGVRFARAGDSMLL